MDELFPAQYETTTDGTEVVIHAAAQTDASMLLGDSPALCRAIEQAYTPLPLHQLSERQLGDFYGATRYLLTTWEAIQSATGIADPLWVESIRLEHDFTVEILNALDGTAV